MAELALLGLVMILGLGAYWSMVIFPRQRDFQKQQQYVSALDVGAEVITYGGIVGRIAELDLDKGVILLTVADGVTMRIIASSIAREYDPMEFAPEPTEPTAQG